MGSEWLTVKGMKGKMGDVFEVFCTVISRDYGRGLKKPTKCLGWFRHQQSSKWEDPKYETEITGLEVKL